MIIEPHQPEKDTLAYDIHSIGQTTLNKPEQLEHKRAKYEALSENNDLVLRVLAGETTFADEYDRKIEDILTGDVWYGYDVADDYKAKVTDLEECVGRIVDDLSGWVRSGATQAALSARDSTSYTENLVSTFTIGSAATAAIWLAYRGVSHKPMPRRLFLTSSLVIGGVCAGVFGVPQAGKAASKLRDLRGWAEYLDTQYQLVYHNVTPKPPERMSEGESWWFSFLTAGGLIGGGIGLYYGLRRVIDWMLNDPELERRRQEKKREEEEELAEFKI